MIDVLIVEDDHASREAMLEWVQANGLEGRAANDLDSGRRAIAQRLPDLALLDLELPDGNGLDLLRELGAAHETEVVMISGRATLDAAIEALRHGARDFLTKPLEMHRLEAIVKSLVLTAELKHEVRALRSELRELGRFGELVGVSPAMQRVYDAIERVAPTDESVFLTGATGTGKELAASTIHYLSRRSSGPFVPVNCAAVPGNLLESAFFGHERGAFTGADKRHQGHFERAHGGTLFLDEITEMPVELQVKLLRVIEASKVTRVGGGRELEVDVRLVAATNRETDAAVREGSLRRDLLYRLLVFPIGMPPLSERDEDVVLLARTFLDRLNREHETTKTYTEAALDRLRRHAWPGNVRELANAVRRAFVLADTHVDAQHLPLDNGTVAGPETGGGASGEAYGDDATPPTGAGIRLAPGTPIKLAEQRLIEATVGALDGRKREAARMLGISLKTLYARLKLYRARRGED
jgi:DNA-binding NtrC family response regulator